MKKRFILKSCILAFLIIFTIFILKTENLNYEKQKRNAFRLHVVANSDNFEDQKIKYAVRDAVLEYTKEDLVNAKTKQDAEEYIDTNLKIIEAEAEKVLSKYNTEYSLYLKTGRQVFPDKTYGNTFYPKGEYDALKIILGEGEGQNWWCVMFPPLCIVGFEKDNREEKESKIDEEDIEYKSFFAEKIKEKNKVE